MWLKALFVVPASGLHSKKLEQAGRQHYKFVCIANVN